MKFIVFSRKEAETPEYLQDHGVIEDHIWISIYTPGDDPANIKADALCKGILPIAFYDTTKEDTNTGIWAMFPEDARKIVDFVQEHKDKVGLICVHCDAGACRSPGTASALSLWLNGHDKEVVGMTKTPNVHVKSMILRNLRTRELI